MTIKQQGGIFGRNPTFNNVEVDGTLSVDGTFDINSAITITATSSTIESTSGAELFLSRDDTAIANNNLIGGLAFKANDSTASPNPQYCGMKAYAAGSGNNPDLEFYAGNGNYDARLPQLSINYLNNVTVETGNLVIGTSGKGIDFSATSDGSGTTTSELFSDYEEGDWTPVIADAASAGNEGTATVDARYTKVGNVVTLVCAINNIVTTGLTSGNDLFITGLPYTSYNLSTAGQIAGAVAVNNITFSGYVTAVLPDNQTYIKLRESATGTAGDFVTVGELSSSADIYFSHTYLT